MRLPLPAGLFTIAAMFAALAPGRAGAAPSYTFFNFDLPGSDPTYAVYTEPYGINGAGQIVGTFCNQTIFCFKGFFRDTGGTYTTLEVPGLIGTTNAHGINDAGQIVGTYIARTAAGSYLRNTDGSYTPLDVPGAIYGIGANGINDLGLIVGSYFDSNGVLHGIVRNPGGSSATLDLPGVSGSTVLNGVNDAGQIVGDYTIGDGIRGFLRNPDGSYLTLDVPGSLPRGSHAYGINNLGQVVGDYYYRGSNGSDTDSIQDTNGFLRDVDGTYTTLHDPDAAHDTVPRDINDAGVVVGYYVDSSLGYHGFIATPQATSVPEPGSYTLLASGLTSLCLAGWRRKADRAAGANHAAI